MKKIIKGLLLASIFLTGCTTPSNQSASNDLKSPLSIKEEPRLTSERSNTMSEKTTKTTEDNQVTLATEKGNITIKLYNKEAPKTVENFLDKAASGYYEGLNFHRVEDWVVQGGDPLGNGTGGGQMATELSKVPFKIGSVGVARGQDIKISNDSQFFICTQDCSFLTEKYTIFGEVVSGMDKVKAIEIGDKIISIKPLKE